MTFQQVAVDERASFAGVDKWYSMLAGVGKWYSMSKGMGADRPRYALYFD